MENSIHALQSGPIIVEQPGRIGITPAERVRGNEYRRSIVAKDNQGRLLLVASTETCLYDLSAFMVKDESEGGLGCVVALNLSGDAQTGLYMNYRESIFTFGDIDVPLASAIVVFLK
jgi:hypothetical protein